MPFIAFSAVFIFLFINLFCTPVLAASITVSSSGKGTYIVVGESMNGVSGIQLTLGYDSAALASPSVTQGSLVSGALFTANTTIPGSIRIAIVKSNPFFGSGQIATLSFAAYDGAGGISSFSARLIDTNGANIPVQTANLAGTTTTPISTPFTTPNPPSTTQTTTNPVVQTPTGSSTTLLPGATVMGSVTMPGDMQPKSEPKPVEPPARLPTPEPTVHPDDVPPGQSEVAEEKPVVPAKVAEPKQISYSSVLERFKKFDDERTPPAMMALFDKPVAKDIHQKPSIAISDGSTRVTIYATLPKGSTSPTFNLSGVEMVSLERDDETDDLILLVLPKKNVIKASVTILTDQTIIIFPLTVVSPGAGVTTEAAFANFLKDSGAKKPRFDLNGDGFHDALDDYIYTGSYLIKKVAEEKKGKK